MRRAHWRVVTALTLVLAAACGGRTFEPSIESSTTTDAAAGTGEGGTGSGGACTSPAAGTMLPASVQVTGGCPAAPACGGDPTGTWNLEETCLLPFDLDPYPSICPGAATNKTSISLANGTSQVRLTFDGARLERTIVTTMSLTGAFPLACFPGHEADSCADKGAVLAARFPGATCSALGDAAALTDCDCQLTITTNASCSNGYTVSGSQIVLDDGDAFDFCVVPQGFINMRQTVASSTSIVAPGLYHARRQ